MFVFVFLFFSLSSAVKLDQPTTPKELDKISWLIGTWTTEHGGTVFWPTVPRVKYGEIMTITPAPYSAAADSCAERNHTCLRFLNVEARAVSYSTKDGFLGVYGFMTVDQDWNVNFFTTGDNGFSTHEVGNVRYMGDGYQMKLKMLESGNGRINFAREMPIKGIEREFRIYGKDYMTQSVFMQTVEHPRTPNRVELHADVQYSLEQ